jgi:hypothetical protein
MEAVHPRVIDSPKLYRASRVKVILVALFTQVEQKLKLCRRGYVVVGSRARVRSRTLAYFALKPFILVLQPFKAKW